jgi:hypothetical protein
MSTNRFIILLIVIEVSQRKYASLPLTEDILQKLIYVECRTKEVL